MKSFAVRFVVIIFITLLAAPPGIAGEARAPSPTEWGKIVEAANKEGKIVAGIPASAELRKNIGEIFSKRSDGPGDASCAGKITTKIPSASTGQNPKISPKQFSNSALRRSGVQCSKDQRALLSHLEL